jgi:hypothetical protein
MAGAEFLIKFINLNSASKKMILNKKKPCPRLEGRAFVCALEQLRT